MTRQDILDRALKIVGEDNLLADARVWLDSVLYDLEARGFWRFLETPTTYQTENNVNTKTFTELSMTNYSKGLAILSDEPRKLRQISKTAFDEADDGATGNPWLFANWNESIWLYPKPVTGKLPILTLRYYKEVTIPTQDSDDMETVVGIKPKWQRYLIDGVIAEGLSYMADERYEQYKRQFDEKVAIMLADNEDYFTSRESTVDRPSLIRTGGAK